MRSRCRRAADGRASRYDIVAIGLGRLRAGRDKGSAPARVEHRKGLLGNLPADGIEDRVAPLNDLREIGGVVVDDLGGPELAHIGAIGRARGRYQVGADMLGKLNGEARNATPAPPFIRIVSPGWSLTTWDRALGFLATMEALAAIFSA
jgi:hypothetical protein